LSVCIYAAHEKKGGVATADWVGWGVSKILIAPASVTATALTPLPLSQL
jgi:hypothetical protein